MKVTLLLKSHSRGGLGKAVFLANVKIFFFFSKMASLLQNLYVKISGGFLCIKQLFKKVYTVQV